MTVWSEKQKGYYFAEKVWLNVIDPASTGLAVEGIYKFVTWILKALLIII